MLRVAHLPDNPVGSVVVELESLALGAFETEQATALGILAGLHLLEVLRAHALVRIGELDPLTIEL